MFALAPGTVRTAMSEYSLDSPEGKKWLPWFRRIFDEGLDLPAERPAQFVLRLASGEADSLSGRFLSVFDDLEVLLRSIREIESNSLHSLRVRKLSERNTALASIHAQAQHALGFTLRLERSFTALCAELFRLWLEPEAIKKWFVYHAPVHWVRPPKVEATPGGQYNWSVTSDDDQQKVFTFHGTYYEIKSNQKIVFTWEWDTLPIEDIEGPGNTVVTLEFVQQGESTRLTLTQANLPSEASRQAHQKGWERCLDGMTKLISERN